jgi:hypothetical protein
MTRSDLARKLGLKPGMKVLVQDAPAHFLSKRPVITLHLLQPGFAGTSGKFFARNSPAYRASIFTFRAVVLLSL